MKKIIVVSLVLAALLVTFVVPATAQAQQQWVQVASFTGKSDKTTAPFDISGSKWRINWTVETEVPEYPGLTMFSCFVYREGETSIYVDTLIHFGPDSDTTYIYEGNGSFYLKIGAANAKSWTVVVEDCIGASPPPESPPPADSGVIKITIGQLYSEYRANEVAADQKYKGRTLQVSGKVNSVKKDVFNQPYIDLGNGASIWCEFDKPDEPLLAQLVKGQSVIVEGVCAGKIIYIHLKHCILVQSGPPPAEPAPPPAEPAPAPSSEEGGGCFIATAAYGTATAQEIDILREFRDDFLLSNGLGAEFVSFYYKTSPPIAGFISQHEVLRTIVREGFVDPVVWIVEASGGFWQN